MSNETVRVTAVNHATIDIACDPQAVWQDIIAALFEGGQFAQLGYRIEPLTDDPAAFLGGYHLVLLNEAGEIADDRVCRITERDDAAMRLSICADYLVPREFALVVNASYQAVRIPAGTRYELHSYSNFNVARPEADATSSLATTVTAFTRQAAEYLDQRLIAMKKRLEARACTTAESTL